MQEEKDGLIERIKRESTGFNLLDPIKQEEEKQRTIKALIKMTKSLGRPLTEKELRELF